MAFLASSTRHRTAALSPEMSDSRDLRIPARANDSGRIESIFTNNYTPLGAAGVLGTCSVPLFYAQRPGELVTGHVHRGGRVHVESERASAAVDEAGRADAGEGSMVDKSRRGWKDFSTPW